MDTRRFWRLFNSLDTDNSASLEFDEFVNLVDKLNDPEKAAQLLQGNESVKTEASVPDFPDFSTQGQQPKLPAGSCMMTELVEQHRQLADIWASVVCLRELKVEQGIDPEGLKKFGLGMTTDQAEAETRAINTGGSERETRAKSIPRSSARCTQICVYEPGGCCAVVAPQIRSRMSSSVL